MGVFKALQHTFGQMGPCAAIQALRKINQKEGFNCQSCAWPSPDRERSFAEFCENGAKAVAYEGTKKRVTPEFFSRYSVAELQTKSEYWLGQQGRLTSPNDSSRRSIALSAHRLGCRLSTTLPRRLTSCALLTRPPFTPPAKRAMRPRFSISSSSVSLAPTICRIVRICATSPAAARCVTSSEVGKGSVSLEDFAKADAIFVIGQNPGTNHPRMLSSLQRAKQRGCKIVSINVLPEVGLMRFTNPQDFANPRKAIPALLGKSTTISDLWLPVRVNGDIAVMKGIMLEMLAREERNPGSVFDRLFIERYCVGVEPFLEELRRTKWAEIEECSGLTRQQIRAAAEVAMQSDRIICCWAMGLTQHRNSVATIEEVMNFLFLRGNIGRPGAGACPVRGHSNVQGDRTMGICENVGQRFLDALGREFRFEPPSRAWSRHR